MSAVSKGPAPHVVTLVMTASVGPLAMNVFLPSLPGMARHFGSEYAVMQLAVSLYLVATALLQFFIGPASDRFGRRPVLLTCFVLFLAGTLAAIFAPTVETLLACRLLQAFSAGGMVISRAVVRDTVGETEAASQLGYITMGTAVVPMLGPTIGGFLDELYGWQASFWMIFGFGVVSFLFALFDLPETNRNKSKSVAAQFRAYPQLLFSVKFWCYTLIAMFCSGAFFAFIGGGPYVATEMLGLKPSQYGIYFGFLPIGYMLGNFLSARFTQRAGINQMMMIGNVVGWAGTLISISLFSVGLHHPVSLFGPVFLTGVGNGLVLPSAIAGAVSINPHLAGSASGLAGAMQIGGGAVLSIIASALLSPRSGPYPLLLVMFVSCTFGILGALYLIRISRKGVRT